MKLHLTRSEGRNLFTGYGDGYVSINHERHSRNIVVAPTGAILDWDAESVEALTPAHVRSLLELKPEIVILGTGERLRFPSAGIARTLAQASVGFEAMDTKAACRTYNILIAEGRNVIAAIFI